MYLPDKDGIKCYIFSVGWPEAVAYPPSMAGVPCTLQSALRGVAQPRDAQAEGVALTSVGRRDVSLPSVLLP